MLRDLAQMEDSKASFRFLRLSAAATTLPHLRALPLAFTMTAVRNSITWSSGRWRQWALAAVGAGPRASKGEPATSQEVEQRPEWAPEESVLAPKPIEDAHQPVGEGGLDLPRAVDVSGLAFDRLSSTGPATLEVVLGNLTATPHGEKLYS